MTRGEEVVRLEPKTMDVLVYLASRAGEVVTREELEAAIWAPAIVGYDAVTTTVLKLRKAFGDEPRQPRIIETISKRGYRLVAPVTSVDPNDHVPPSSTVRRRGGAAWIILILAVVTAGTLLWLGQTGTLDRPDRDRVATIAVLPFSNPGGDAGQAYLADGIADDLITDLTKISGLFVISRDSSFSYRDEPLDVADIAERLGVRYLLHGSVRRAGGRVRINAQLMDAANGKQLWAERYDGDATDLFDLQDRITRQIVASLAVRLTDAERRRLAIKDTGSPAAYDAFLRGEERFFRYARTSNREARALFERAVALDPGFARANAMLGWTHVFDFMNGWSDAPAESLARAEHSATRALELNDSLPVAYFVRGLVHRERAEYVKALVEAQKAIELDSNYANGHVLLATLLYYAGRPEEGLERMRIAVQLNPHHPYNYPFHMGQAYFVLGRYPEAIAAFKQGLASNPASERLRVWLAASYAVTGDIEQAAWEMEQVRLANPQVSLERFRQAFPFKDRSDLERFLNGLRKAGLSDSAAG